MSLPQPIVVFVRPQAAGNIGAISRVMSNFGVTELRLVGQDPSLNRDPDAPSFDIDWALAKRRDSIRESARWYPDLKSALEGTHLAMGTSGREVEFDLGYARPLVTPEAALSTVANAHAQVSEDDSQFRWALVFGPEDDGLCDDEAALCQQLIRIPTHEMNTSMNIAMAAGVLLYHWNLFARGVAEPIKDPLSNTFLGSRQRERAESTKSGVAGRTEWASFEHKEIFLNYVMETVAKTSFLKYPDREAVAARIRRWLQQGQIPVGELLFAFEIVYHLRAWGTGTFEQRDFLKWPRSTESSTDQSQSLQSLKPDREQS